jgi:hypothetical protein
MKLRSQMPEPMPSFSTSLTASFLWSIYVWCSVTAASPGYAGKDFDVQAEIAVLAKDLQRF